LQHKLKEEQSLDTYYRQKKCMQKDFEQMWEDCLTVIKDIVPQAAFEAWFRPIIPLSYEDGKLTIQVPSQFFYEYHYHTKTEN